MREMGFSNVACGPDGPSARKIAESWNERWRTTKQAGVPRQPEGRTAGYVYFLTFGDRVKIGFTNNPASRIGALRTGLPGTIGAIVMLPGTRSDERAIHQRLAPFRRTGERLSNVPAVKRVMLRCCLAFGRIMHSEPDNITLLDEAG